MAPQTSVSTTPISTPARRTAAAGRTRAHRASPRAAAVLTPLLLSAAALLAVQQQRAPEPREGEGAAAFSIQRAVAHAGRLAAAPRPSGSPAAAGARAYIAGELTRLGLAPVEQHVAILTRNGAGRQTWSPVRNVLARLHGTAPAGALLLVAHYDSHASSPGAGDNASGVAALLEAARVLRAGPVPRNDVIWLFSDAEEANLAGAGAFVSKHEWARDVRVVLNFEARGTSGPSLMFETIGSSGWLVRQLAGAAAFPRASSLYDLIYEAMPNDTDLSAFRDLRVAGMNFAFIERPGRYHTSGDTVASLDRASLYHQGVNAVGLARALGNASLRAPAAGEDVYFTMGNVLVRYSRVSQWWQALAGAVLLVVCGWLATRDRRVHGRHVAAAFAVAIAATAVSAGAAHGASIAGRLLAPALGTPALRLYTSAPWMAGAVLLSAAIVCAGLALAGRRAARLALVLGGSLAGLAAALVAAAYVPGAGYLLVWPVLANGLCVAALVRYGDRDFWYGAMSDPVPCRTRDAAVALLCALPSAVLLAPVVHVVFGAVGTRAMAVAAALVAAGLAPAWPMLLAAAGRRVPHAAAACGLAAVVVLGFAAAGARTGVDWPKHNNVFYARSLDDGQAVWGTRERQRDPWTAQFLGASPRWGVPLACLAGAGEFLHAAAAPVAGGEAEVVVARNEMVEGTRVVELQIRSDEDAGLALVHAAPPPAPVFLTAVSGVGVDDRYAREPFVSLNARAEPGRAVVVLFETSSAAPMRFTLIDSVNALPGGGHTPRPEGVVRGGEGRLFNDASVTCRTIAVEHAADAPVPAAIARRRSS